MIRHVNQQIKGQRSTDAPVKPRRFDCARPPRGEKLIRVVLEREDDHAVEVAVLESADAEKPSNSLKYKATNT